jgi:hypothetical protein
VKAQRSDVRSIAWSGLWWVIILKLWPEILSDDCTKREVGNRNRDDKADDLKNASHLLERHGTGAEESGNEAADDHADESAANRDDDEEQKPSFEILEFGGFFHVVWNRSNESKMSDGGRERASLEVGGWKSSQKWSVQRSGVRSIA